MVLIIRGKAKRVHLNPIRKKITLYIQKKLFFNAYIIDDESLSVTADNIVPNYQ